ncbi:MAG: nicotinate-nucleotide--dimethylbenzimidazole phosphoribosyltransferase [Bacteroidales bacterium]|nr:nicotinate-nucleotide--dimethylbenzimidazole phosphoribosyltransferase [Bacteroidales bacterium]
MDFNISSPKREILTELDYKINDLSKPKGSLGRLESLAKQIGWIQQTLTPTLKHPQNIIFAADHGIVEEGVSQSPQEVTRQVINNFLNGGQGINFLAKQHGFEIKIVDAGINYDLPPLKGVIDRKIRKSTRNYLYESALTSSEVEKALNYGAEITDMCVNEGSNILSFGEMGIGNTSTSSMWMTLLTGIPLDKCVGVGSGLDSEGVKHKKEVLKKALDNYQGTNDVMQVITYFGGLEMVMSVGAMIRAAQKGVIILVDGFIMTNCMLAASKISPNILDYAIFGHQGDEAGHKLVIDYLGVKPLLHLDMRLGEGSGALCAYPIVDSAVRMINEMNTFSNAHITKYF